MVVGDRAPGGEFGDDRVDHSLDVTTDPRLEFREGLVEDLEALLSNFPDEFREGREALDRFKSALTCLTESKESVEDHAAVDEAPSSIMATMVAIEQRTARVERGFDALSGSARRIVSSAIEELRVDEVRDGRAGNGERVNEDL
jgi:hypothetical protein